MNPKDYPSLRTRRSFIRQMACAALGTSALTNAIRDLRIINAAVAQTAISDYKALVCIFLNGGNDSNNLIIPTISSEYADYATIRTPSLAIPAGNILPLSPLSSDGHDYGFHPACPELQTLFNSGKLATVFNVGTLVYPLTKVQYSANSVPRPPQLFSHSDQQAQWQTSIPDMPSTTGWGGRCADLLDTINPHNSGAAGLSMCVSLAGANTFEVGGVVQQYAVTTSGVVSLNTTLGPSAARTPRQAALNSILGIDAVQANMLTQNYALALEHALATGSSLSTSLGNSPLAGFWSSYPANIVVPNAGGTITNSSLMAQLKMVAKIIDAGYRSAAQGGLGMKRQIFFCQVSGYDTHSNQTNNAGSTTLNPSRVIVGSQASLLAELSQSINAFQNAMNAIGVQYGDPAFDQRVTSFTASDFGRTFPSNGVGSDHGWGGHHLVVGGGVRGQRTYGKFPVLTVGGPDDTSTGRWIPTTSVDQFAASMARWFGVDNSNMSTVFPNLGRFSVPDIGFMN